MSLRAGDVCRLFLHRTTPPKEKLVICVDPDKNLFLFINSRPPIPAEAGVSVGPHEIECLEYASYIDTAGLRICYGAGKMVLEEPERKLGNIGPGVRAAIKRAILDHDVMPGRDMKLVTENL